MVNAPRSLTATTALGLAFLLVSHFAGQAMELTSPDFANAAKLPLAQVHARCGGQNLSPSLRWSGAPGNTRSFALTLFDPDAGGGAGFWHWVVFDIPAAATTLRRGAGGGSGLPPGAIQTANGFGDAGYGGACPPQGSGLHHYQFTLYALGTPQAPFGANTDSQELAGYLKAHALATASLTATYSR